MVYNQDFKINTFDKPLKTGCIQSRLCMSYSVVLRSTQCLLCDLLGTFEFF